MNAVAVSAPPRSLPPPAMDGVGVSGRSVLPVKERHACTVDGCDKTFSRKEHLSRHARSHDEKNLFACSECEKSFSRSDSLVRHLARHGTAFIPNPSGRSKKACISCHLGKTKCDGSKPCSTCTKKDIDCVYRQEDRNHSTSSESVSSRAMSPNASDQMSSIQEDTLSLPASSPTTSPEPSSFESSKPVTGSRPLSVAPHAHPHPSRELETSMITMPPPRLGYMELMNMRIQRDPQDDFAMSIDDKEVTPLDRQYLDSFYDNFQFRWSLIHRPSFEEANNDTPLIAAMKMIGAWLMGIRESKEYALSVHERLVNNLLPRLSGFDSNNGLCLGMCETALLNIVFALYYGNDKAISTAFTLRNLLVGVLREVHFFDAKTAWADEKAGYFLAMHIMKLGQRQKLALSLFKIDTYLSLLRGQPKVLLPEDLYFTLPPTHAVWECDGLDIWQERYAREPPHRSKKTMSDIITDNLSISSSIDYPMLIEDVQLCMCAIQSSLWKLHHTAHPTKETEVNTVLEKDSLRRMLHNLQKKLDRMANQHGSNTGFGEEFHLPLRNYFGYEDHSLFGWQQIVSARVRSLHFDAIMLSYLFNLHLSADIASLSHLSKSQILTPIQQESQRFMILHSSKQDKARIWAASSLGRQALCTAVDILLEHQTIARERVPGLEVHKMDPIAHIATSVAALVVWAYCTYSKHQCAHGSPNLLPDAQCSGKHVIELAKWCERRDHEQQSLRQKWVESGGGMRVVVQSATVCGCNVDQLTTKFLMCLPEGWEVAETIAAGVLRR